MILKVLDPGLQTTVQDLGRTGYRHLGVGRSGAADPLSLQLANLLAGNSPSAAALELTIKGPRLRFCAAPAEDARTIAICGADIAAEFRLEDSEKSLPVAIRRPVRLPAGGELSLKTCSGGARAYLAIAGGLAVPAVLGSRSTDLHGGFGGLHGRALRVGDELPLAEAPPDEAPRDAAEGAMNPGWQVRAPGFDAATGVLRILPGSHADLLDTAARRALFGQDAAVFVVAAESSRMGVRLLGPRLCGEKRGELTSEPVSPGTVQLPPGGSPIILGVEAPTTGGYPRVAHVIDADLPCLGQLRPGDCVSFQVVSWEEAQAAGREQEQRLARVALALDLVL
jgi:antagonist of KipI